MAGALSFFKPFSIDGLGAAPGPGDWRSIPLSTVGDSLTQLWGAGRATGAPARFSQPFSWMDLMERYRDYPLVEETDSFTASMLNERGNIILQLCAPIKRMNENSVTLHDTEIYQMPYNLVAAGGVPRTTDYRRETRSYQLRLYKRYFPIEIAYLQDPRFGRPALNDIVGTLASQAFLTLAAQASMAIVYIPFQNMARRFSGLPSSSAANSARQVHMESMAFALAHKSPNDLVRLITNQRDSMNGIDLCVLPEGAGRLLEGIQGESRSIPAYHQAYDEKTGNFFRVLYQGPRSLKSITMGDGSIMDFIENPSYRYSSLDDDPVQTLRSFPVLAEVVVQNVRDAEEVPSGDPADLDVWVHHQTETSITLAPLRFVEGLKWCGLWNNRDGGFNANSTDPGDFLAELIDRYNETPAKSDLVSRYLLDDLRDNNTPSMRDVKKKELREMDDFRQYCGFVSVGQVPHGGRAAVQGIVPAKRIGDLPLRTLPRRYVESAARAIVEQGLRKFGLKRDEMESGAADLMVTTKWMNDFRRIIENALPTVNWADVQSVLPTVAAVPQVANVAPVVSQDLQTQFDEMVAVLTDMATNNRLPRGAAITKYTAWRGAVNGGDLITLGENPNDTRNAAIIEMLYDNRIKPVVWALAMRVLAAVYPVALHDGRDMRTQAVYRRLNSVILIEIVMQALMATLVELKDVHVGGGGALNAAAQAVLAWLGYNVPVNVDAGAIRDYAGTYLSRELATETFFARVTASVVGFAKDEGEYYGWSAEIRGAYQAAHVNAHPPTLANLTVAQIGARRVGAAAAVAPGAAIQPQIFRARAMAGQSRQEFLAAATSDALLAESRDSRWARALAHIPDASLQEYLTFAHGAEHQLAALAQAPEQLAAAERGVQTALDKLAEHAGKSSVTQLVSTLASHVTEGKPLAELAERPLISTRALQRAEPLAPGLMTFATRFAAGAGAGAPAREVDAMDIDALAQPLGHFVGDLGRVNAVMNPPVGGAAAPAPRQYGPRPAVGAARANVAGVTECMRRRLADLQASGTTDLTGYAILALLLAPNSLATHQALAQRCSVQLLRLNYFRPFQRYRMLCITAMRGGDRTMVTGLGHSIVTPSLEGIEGYVNITVQFRSGLIPLTPDRIKLIPYAICDRMFSDINCNFVTTQADFDDPSFQKPSVVASPVPLDETQYTYPMHLQNLNIYKPNDTTGPNVHSKHSGADLLGVYAGDAFFQVNYAQMATSDIWTPLNVSFVAHRSCAHYWKSRLGQYVSIPGTGPRDRVDYNVPGAAGVWAGMAEKFSDRYAVSINA